MIKNNIRLVVLGSKSFVAKNVIKEIKKKNYKIKIVKISRKYADLEDRKQIMKIKKVFKAHDTVFFAAAKAPAKNFLDYLYNVRICKNVINSINKTSIDHLIYLSSDAVFSDIKNKIKEDSPKNPNSYHGKMHLKRERLLKKKFKEKLTILRPTLIYGKDDPHNGYGPNKFVRLAKKNKNIEIFGEGEEKRDHVHIEDVSYIITKIIKNKLIGEFNIATGNLTSFLDIAIKCINYTNSRSKLIKIKRKSKKLPHNGYRPFNVKKIKSFFKNKNIININKGIQKLIR